MEMSRNSRKYVTKAGEYGLSVRRIYSTRIGMEKSETGLTRISRQLKKISDQSTCASAKGRLNTRLPPNKTSSIEPCQIVKGELSSATHALLTP